MQTSYSNPELLIEQEFVRILQSFDSLFFLQIGGFDSNHISPLHTLIKRHSRLTGLITEPLADNFSKLNDLYAQSESITICHYAIHHEHGTQTVWRFKPAAIERKTLNPVYANIHSFDMDDLLSDHGNLGRMFHQPQRDALKILTEPITVPCCPMENLLQERHVSKIDFLEINIDECNLNIINSFDFIRYLPEMVHYKHTFLNNHDRLAVEHTLSTFRYKVIHFNQSTLAVRTTHPVLRIGYYLQQEKRLYDALTLYRHVISLEPDNIDALSWSAIILGLQGSFEEMLQLVLTIKKHDPTIKWDAQIVKSAPHVSPVFKQYLASGDHEKAAIILEALLVLYPNNVVIFNNIPRLIQYLSCDEHVIDVMIKLLEIEPTTEIVHQKMLACCKQASYQNRRIEQCLTKARQTHDNSHVVSKLQHLYHALSAILSVDLDDTKIAWIDELTELAHNLVSEHSVVATDPLYHGYRFYYSSIDTLNIHAVMQPTPSPAPWPTIQFASSLGNIIDIQDVISSAHNQRAQVVFFVAADLNYIKRYTHRYVSSLIKNCDVPALIIIHVVGGNHHLQSVASTVGIHDSRLIYSGDSFDPNTIRSVTSNTTSRKISRDLSLIVYYQSARFLWLGYILESVSLPVIVTDIDQLLQRGIQDMLAKYAKMDVVFHESPCNKMASSRLIANLLLINPTRNGTIFARFLRHYLNTALHHVENTGFGAAFLDQGGLLMAYHHVLQVANPNIGYFELYDINSGMYHAFEETPFRFFSFYTGFDIKTLPG